MIEREQLEQALRTATGAALRARQELDEARARKHAPMAIVGVALRLPGGAEDLDSLWRVLTDGTDTLREIPPDRFDVADVHDPDPERAGTTYVRHASLLDDVAGFDAAHFRISPREALPMDPQHRLLLEASWTALEDAGFDPRKLKDSTTGVFVGIGPNEYGEHRRRPVGEAEAYDLTGRLTAFAGGRLAYHLGLQGPALSVDTACSASLVALHLAIEHLRAGRCDLALACGVQVIVDPDTFVLLSRTRAVSPDGRCKTFSALADGYGRGEGVGVLALMRLDEAVAQARRVHAIVRGTAVNHDGASAGITAPNGASQQRLLRAALDDARLDPTDVDFVECHGTGTALGDPIEVQALDAVYGKSRRQEPLGIGAVKATLGHLESAAGVAGVLKVLASFRHGALPPSRHSSPPNPHLEWERLDVRVVDAVTPWPRRRDRPRRAAVSAFGMSGTNAHVILEEPPAPPIFVSRPTLDVQPVVLSASTPDALAENARRLAAHLARAAAVSPAELAASLTKTRTALPRRLTLVATAKDAADGYPSLREALLAFAETGQVPHDGHVTPDARASGRLAALFTGQGSQHGGMGRALHGRPGLEAFTAAFDAAAAACDRHLDRSVSEVAWADDLTVHRTRYAQPALFVLETALFRQWEALGARPEVLLGHSVGEIAAAHVAGVLSLDDAAALVCSRARLMDEMAIAGGRMAAVDATEEEMRAAIAEGAEVTIAAVNGARSVVVSGDAAAVARIVVAFDARGRRAGYLKVSHAFHSAHMDGMLEAFRAVAGRLTYATPTVDVVSNVTGAIADVARGDLVTPDYWVRQVRQTVRFADGVRAATSLGATTFFECGPDATLSGLVLASAEASVSAVPSLRKGGDELVALASAIGCVLARGHALDTAPLCAGARCVPLPTSAFSRERYWLDPTPSRDSVAAPDGSWPLAGKVVELPEGGALHRVQIGPGAQGYLADHVVYGTIVAPGALYLSVLLAVVAQDLGEDHDLELSDVQFHRALTFASPRERVTLHVHLTPPSDDGTRRATLTAKKDGVWTTHATAAVGPATAPISEIPPAGLASLPLDRNADALHARLAASHIEWGPRWRWVIGTGEIGGVRASRLAAPEGVATGEAPLPPGLMDASFPLAIGALEGDVPFLPFRIERIRVRRGGGAAVWACGATTEAGTAVRVGRLAWFDEQGRAVAVMEGFTAHRAPIDRFFDDRSAVRDLHTLAAVPVDMPDSHPEEPARVVTVTETEGFALPDAESVLLDVRVERPRVAALLTALQERLSREAPALARVTLVTRGAVSLGPGDPAANPDHAALWGLLRSLRAERPEVEVSLLDVDLNDDSAAHVVRAANAGHAEALLRDGRLFRLALGPLPSGDRAALDPPPHGPWRMWRPDDGVLDHLRLGVAEDALRTLADGEVRVEVRAAALNFRDVLNALGAYPGDAGPLGGELAGVVTETTPSAGFAVGDRVFGMAPHSFATTAVADARELANVPDHLSFAEAATLPVAFLTALHGLETIAGLHARQRVLVHAGAGGVGMAAIHVARRLGAEVFATSSSAKWRHLRELGLDDAHIASSRDPSFTERVLATTRGEGVDVVLNALVGELVDASLSLLPRGGVFLEMGKRDARDPAQVAARHPGVRYVQYDILLLSPADRGASFRRIARACSDGTISPLPYRALDMRRGRDAFRWMAQGRHVGKLVLVPPRRLDAAGTVLLTGGTGALGRVVAEHLVRRHGVRHLLLLARTGLDAPDSDAFVARLREAGAEGVSLAECDATDRDALAGVLASIPAVRPLTAVLHLAGRLRDATFPAQTTDALDDVLGAKLTAARHLDELTRAHDTVGTFILFSSVAGLLGSPAQAGYAAANAALDAFAAKRRAEGFPALSLAWGPWDEVGMAAKLAAADKARLARSGTPLLRVNHALALLDAALDACEANLAAFRLDASALVATPNPPPLLASRLPRTTQSIAAAAWPVAEDLSNVDPQTRRSRVLEIVRTEVAHVLRLPGPDSVPAGGSLDALGLDSLMAVELRNRLGKRVGVVLPTSLAYDHPTPDALASFLADDEFGARRATETAARAAPAPDDGAVAIVGMACRLPGGVEDPDGLWALLEARRDATSPLPADRGWHTDGLYDPDPASVGTTCTSRGGFLTRPDRFDARMFGISAREAEAMDPQQRLLLETAWEAIERANISPASLENTATGVFLGVSYDDYQRLAPSAQAVDGYVTLGTARSVAAGRIAYTFGLQGPAVTVDTACSSSLVALHQAARALRAGECTLALTGGATVFGTPEPLVVFSRLRALSPDGRCKAFSETADGAGWAEGVCLLVLERLSDARRNGHPVLAIVRGSAVNQDGRSQGMTAPNGPAQQRVIRAALEDAGLDAADVDLIEAHGTGTPLGDPIEAHALLATYGAAHAPSAPAWLGTVKSNVGHTQSAAGVVGVLKAVLALRHGVLPATLHADTPSSRIDWSSGRLALLTEARPWPRGRVRRAAVSSFGISGTNAHVVLEEAPDTPSAGGPRNARVALSPPAAWPLLVSGKTEAALCAQAWRLREHLEAHVEPLRDVAYSLATTRTHFEHRAAVVARDRAEAMTALASLAQGQPSAQTVLGQGRGQGKVAVLFTGQGSQRPRMGRALYEAFPVFRDAFDAVCAHLDHELPRPLREVLFADEVSPDAGLLDQTVFTQPALFALEVALFRLLESIGLKPDLLLGHSIGELVAAHLAGVLSLQDACTLVAARGSLMQALPQQGAMLALEASEDEVLSWLAVLDPRASLAALNAPDSTVVAGDSDAVAQIAAHVEALGRKTTRLRVSHAFHSPHMDGMLEAFRRVAAGLTWDRARVALVSNVTGSLASNEQLASPDYWVRQVRQTVRFVDGVRSLDSLGVRTYVELGPDAVLSVLAQRTLPDGGARSFIPALRKGRNDVDSFLSALGELHVQGLALDWHALFAPFSPGRVELPTYAFQRERYWLEAPKTQAAELAATGQSSAEHPMLSAVIVLADGNGFLLTGRLSLSEHPWLADHAVFGRPLVPGTGFLELALLAAQRVGLERVEELTLEAPLALPAQGEILLQMAIGAPDDSGRRHLAIHSRPQDAAQDVAWTRHARGLLAGTDESTQFDLRAWPPPGATRVAIDGLYEALANAGLAYGPHFRGLQAVWKRGDELFAEVRLPDSLGTEARAFLLHPALLDAALHALAVERTDVELPFCWTGVSLRAVGATCLRVRLQRKPEDATVAIALANAVGEPLANIQALSTRLAAPSTLRSSSAFDALLRLDWTEVTGTPLTQSPTSAWAWIGEENPALRARALSFQHYRDFAALRRALDQGASPPNLVVAHWSAVGGESLVASAHHATGDALALLQDWLSDDRLAYSRLVALTQRAIATRPDEDVLDLTHAPLWGLLRSAQSEFPQLPLYLIDLDDSEESLRALFEALEGGEERQLAVRDGRRLVPRLARARSDEMLIAPESPTWRLHVPTKGTLDALTLVAHPEAQWALEAGQVRIAVYAAGLNFRDVLDTLDMYPGEAGPLGGEGAGIVIEVGPGVSRFQVGDRVMGIFAAAFGPVAIADVRLLVRVPAHWSFVQAASVPIVFLTAYYGLRDLGHLQAGQRVLIHAAAGGVGSAAVQLARHWGAEVFATASAGKWAALRAQGFDEAHLASSRTLDFEQHFLRSTQGAGMSVVLDCLAGEFVDASLRLLVGGGRFVEMGKTDVREPSAVRLVHPGVHYRAFDLMEAGPERIEQMFAELLELFERGVLKPVPITAWDLRQAPQAMRALGQARHVGKFVLTVPRGLDPEGTVLITGGTGTLGARVARHLVAEHGVKHLLLTSRQGADTPGAEALRSELQAIGASVTIARCDATDRGALQALLAAIPPSHPLTAVVHAAGVLDDGLLGAMTPERLDRVLGPKLDGAWHLHQLTQDCDLAAFVLFSSVSGVLGAPGQSNYAAANSFLDALAHHRRAQGLSATSLAWSFWAEKSGMTAHLSAADTARMKRAGMRALTTEQGLALLDAALQRPEPALVPVPLDPVALGARPEAAHPLLRGLVRARSSLPVAANAAGAASLTQRLVSLPAAERERALLELVGAEAGAVLGLASSDSLEPHRPFQELGLDSLMAVELRNRLGAATGMQFAATLLFNHPTPAALAEFLLGKLLPDERPIEGSDTELDRIEGALLGLYANEPMRADLKARLQGLLSKWTNDDEGAPSASGLTDLLRQSSHDELFGLIDRVRTEIAR